VVGESWLGHLKNIGVSNLVASHKHYQNDSKTKKDTLQETDQT